MKRLSRRALIFVVAGIVAGAAFVGHVRYADAWQLTTVTVDATPIDGWEEQFAFDADKSAADQPLDDIARQLLARSDVHKVNVDISLPNEVRIKLNNFAPLCFVLEESTGQLFGLDRQARVVALPDGRPADWQCPVLTTVQCGRLYDLCQDGRTRLVVNQLVELEEEHRDLFRLIDEIDFGNAAFLKVSLAGLSYRLKVRAERLLEDLGRFVEFISSYDVPLEGVRILDLRFENMVIVGDSKR